ncbi:uncharacterized protein LOC5513994 [Nematostella vectensis]|uniref:uncharacterized protein LOC5513994 n=1 Tax=Nematostella vectensis TaxID=45351 RepID=UPI002077693F|nr:uncharacterized protein LOC5513994 [Nematostella vectensis]
MGEYNLEISEGKSSVSASTKRKLYIILSVCCVVILVGLALVIVGGVRLNKTCTKASVGERQSGSCGYSTQAARAGLDKLLDEVKSTYYKMNPNNIAYDPDVSSEDFKSIFSPYNCHPDAIKRRTDTARMLYDKAIRLEGEVKQEELQPREVKALSQLKHFLQSNFGAPYDENYYAGDWLLGPNLFCWQAICYVGSDIMSHFNLKSYGFKPKSLSDVEFVIDHLKQLNDSLMQYIENMRYGVKAGYVRSQEECKAGLLSFQTKYKVVARLGERGILNSTTTKDMRNPIWYQSLTADARKDWGDKHPGQSVEAGVQESLVKYVGRPLVKVMEYLENEHARHCVPSNISSGLATLPLDFIYDIGTSTGVKTTKVLPNGDKLDGRKAYKMILPYFTTTDMSPDEIHQLGWDMLGKLYPEAVRIAQEITELSDEEAAVKEFKGILENQTMFFNDQAFPANESDKEAFLKCNSMESARQYCPTRYASMRRWFDYVNGVLSALVAKLPYRMFYYTGDKRSTPNCPVLLVANFNPATGSQSYSGAGITCGRACHYRLPFFLKDYGPKYNAWSVAAHEARPGHHTQVQGFSELFSDKCGGVIGWLNGISYYTAFTEGWALYAENPLINSETDTYSDQPLQKYGMLKWQIWRALRLIMDTGLHYKGMKRDEALELFAKYAWDRTDKAIKDVTRYQSDPGQATAYMIGQLAIWRYRNHTEQRLQEENKMFNEKEFHFQVLSQGASPLSYLESHLQKYTECLITKSSGCDSILNPPFSPASYDETIESSVRKQTSSFAFYDKSEEETFADLESDWHEGLGKPRNPRHHPESHD